MPAHRRARGAPRLRAVAAQSERSRVPCAKRAPERGARELRASRISVRRDAALLRDRARARSADRRKRGAAQALRYPDSARGLMKALLFAFAVLAAPLAA